MQENNINQNALNWPSLKFYKHHVYGDDIESKTMYDIIFEGEDRCAEQYLKLLTELIDFIEIEMKPEKPNSPEYVVAVMKLLQSQHFAKLFRESQKVDIDCDEALSYVFDRVTQADFQYPLTFIHGDKLSFIELEEEGVKRVTYKPDPCDMKDLIRVTEQFDADPRTDRFFTEYFNCPRY